MKQKKKSKTVKKNGFSMCFEVGGGSEIDQKSIKIRSRLHDSAPFFEEKPIPAAKMSENAPKRSENAQNH